MSPCDSLKYSTNSRQTNMYWLYILITNLITIVVSLQSHPEDDYYNAAVVEYSPVKGDDGNDMLNKNAEEYVHIIKQAAGSADIVVFPELGLNYDDDTFFIDIPFGKDIVAPAENSSLHPALRQLSKAAKDNQVYVSFTVHEKEDSSNKETLKFNTNVVFDRNGVIVAKYRKYNLFNEPEINITNIPEAIFFDSDFGVRFGMFICFDIMFKDPALKLVNEMNITDIIYPSWWFSELPSLLSIQVQFAWAYMTDTNLLASGINNIQTSSTGSGIYAGKKGPLTYIFSERKETVILTAKLYKKGRSGKSEGKFLERFNSRNEINLKLWHEDLQFYKTHLLTYSLKNVCENYAKSVILSNEVLTTLKNNEPKLINSQMVNKTICQGTLCCEFSINMTFKYELFSKLNMSDPSYNKNDSFYHYQYRLGVFNGVRGFYNSNSTGIQVCSVIPCLNSSLSSCGIMTTHTMPLIINSSHGEIFLQSTSFDSIVIKAFTQEKTDFTFPYVLDSSNSDSLKAFSSIPNPEKLKFIKYDLSSEMTFSSDKLISTGIYSRIISRDGGKIGVKNH